MVPTDMDSGENAAQAQTWLLEDLRARNAEILETHRSMNGVFNFALLALAGLLSFLGAGGATLLHEWATLFYLGAALLFLGFTLKLIFYEYFFAMSGYYIECDLLPRLARYHARPSELYGWERFIREWQISSWPSAFSTTAEVLLVVLPGVGFLVIGIATLVRLSSALYLAAGSVLVLFNVLLAAGGIIIAIASLRLRTRRLSEPLRRQTSIQDPSQEERI